MSLLSQVFLLIGAFFMFVAAVGIYRMPDLYMRLHTNTKSATFGVSFILLGAIVHFWDLAVTTRAIAIILFLFVTAPIAAHMIGRAAYIVGAPLWPGTLSDALKGMYDPTTHKLAETLLPEAAPNASDLTAPSADHPFSH